MGKMDENTSTDWNRPADHLGGATLSSLTRRIGCKESWGVVKSILLGGLSFGILPLILWPMMLRDFIWMERTQLEHLADWLRRNSGHAAAVELPAAARRIRMRRWPLWLGALALYVAILSLTVGFTFLADSRSLHLIDLTYGFRQQPSHVRRDIFGVFAGWTLALSAGYGFHWLQVLLHAWDVRRFLRKFNEVALYEGLAPISWKYLGVGVRPLWVMGAVAMIVCGGLWGVPMMLAGAVHRRYVNAVSPWTRAALAQRLRDMLMRRRPMMNMELPVGVRLRCGRERCRVALPTGAAYCPRCGMRVVAGVEVMA